MPLFRDRQTRFHAALLDRDQSVPVGVIGPDGKCAGSRFDVYRNNRMVSMIEALAVVYPAVETLVGKDFFRAMAREFIVVHPPISPILIDYGDGFPGFVAAFGPAQELDYLSDVARVEWEWHRAYHAADADSASPDLLAGLPSDRVARLRFVFHPSVRVLVSAFPAISLWNANCSNLVTPGARITWCDETGLIYRSGVEVVVSIVPPGRAHFLLALFDGQTLLSAAGSAVDADPQFDLSQAISDILSLGIVTAYQS